MQLQVDDQQRKIAGTSSELEKSEELERLGVVGRPRRHTHRQSTTRRGSSDEEIMGVSASKAEEDEQQQLHKSSNKAGSQQCSPAKLISSDSREITTTVGFKASSLDSPGSSSSSSSSSAEVGDIGKLGTLLCSSRTTTRHETMDVEAAAAAAAGFGSETHHHESMLQRRFSGSSTALGEISFTSYLRSPLIRELHDSCSLHGFDAIAKSYVESAGKAAARDTFMFLKENDHAQLMGTSISTTQLSSDTTRIHRFPAVPDSSSSSTLQLDYAHGEAAADILGADKCYSQPDQTHDLVIDFEVSPVKPELVSWSPAPPPSPLRPPSSSSSSVEAHKSLFEACFPATSRWASVVNAARQSACLPTRPLIRLPAANHVTDKRKDQAAAGEQDFQCPTAAGLSSDESHARLLSNRSVPIFDSGIRSSATQNAENSPASIQECVGCRGGEKGLVQWVDAKSAASSARSESSPASGCSQQHKRANSLKLRTSDCAVQFSTDHVMSLSSSTTTTGEDLESQGCLACFSLANGLRMNLPTATVKESKSSSSCSSSIMVCSNKSRAMQAEHTANYQAGSDLQPDHDPDADAFFSFPSSPSAAHAHDQHEAVMIAAASRKINYIEGPPVECFKDCIEPLKCVQTQQQQQGARRLGLNHHHRHVPGFSKGAAFGSPFPVHCATTTTHSRCKAQQQQLLPDFVENNLKLFSLEQACTLTLAWNSVAMDSLRASTATTTTEPESSPETSSSNRDSGFRDHVHDTDDSSSDLFEIGNIQPGTSIVGFNRLDFPHLPIKTSFGAKEVHSEISSPPISNPGNYFVSFPHSLVLSASKESGVQEGICHKLV